ncbi:YncE family protein [Aurantivibrio plasticivorans]
MRQGNNKYSIKDLLCATLVASGGLISCTAFAQTTVYEESFDNGTGQYTTSGRVYSGSYGVRLRGGSSSSITSPSISTQGFEDLSISFDRGTSGLDSGEAGIAEVAINGGSFQPIESTQSSAQRVTFELPQSADNSSLQLRFRLSASSFFETYEIDNIVLEGTGDDNPPPPPPVNRDVPEAGDFVTFETGHVRPMALSPDGNRLYTVNTPDNRVEVFNVSGNTPVLIESILVGLEPVAVALKDSGELWVVNHLSDSISIVDVSQTPARITKTLLVGDEPRDIVFAGSNNRFAFITAAHRGQNAPFDPQLQTEGIGRADVWVFNSNNTGSSLTGTPVTILNMFGDTMRGLARNASGTRVYAAVLNSGNKTTVITDDRGEGGIEKAPPYTDSAGDEQPETGLIVQFDGQNWKDHGDPTRGVAPQIWNSRVNLNLPDYDVFTIDASATTPRVIDRVSGVGTTLFNLAVNPANGNVYVSNTEARNLVRFEGPGSRSTTVRGHFVESRITVIDDGNVLPRHLNKHIDYSRNLGTTSEKARALATPLEMAVTSDGSTLFVAAMSSNKLARLNTNQLENNTFSPSTADQLVLTGGAPTGVVLDEGRGRAFVTTRYDNGVSVVSIASGLAETAHVTMHNPEPEIVKTGRRFLYDANYTSSRGDSSCSGCHTFGDMDHLAWDLGNPDDEVVRNPGEYNENIFFFGRNRDLHPMKGPMTTQSLRGLRGNGPMHWRGDRTGQSADANETIEEQAFEDFNVAFTGLLARENQLTTAEMDAFAKFALEITYPPNPVANLDNSLTPRQQDALDIYNNVVSDTITTCNGCHRLNVNLNQFGTDGTMATEGPGVEEDMKIPHLRNMYQKVGMFATNSQLRQFPNLGDQIRGFGFDNAGSHGTIFDFLSEDVFTLNDADTRLVEELSLAFSSEMNPIVGQQVTVAAGNSSRSDVVNRVSLLIERALVVVPRPECDLVASTVLGGDAISFVMNDSQAFVPNDSSVAVHTRTSLISTAINQGSAVTFTCTPPGNGTRIGVDRDSDGVFDKDA